MVPDVNMYTTMPAITAMAMSISVANIGEMAFLFLINLVNFIFFVTPPLEIIFSAIHFKSFFINYVIRAKFLRIFSKNVSLNILSYELKINFSSLVKIVLFLLN